MTTKQINIWDAMNLDANGDGARVEYIEDVVVFHDGCDINAAWEDEFDAAREWAESEPSTGFDGDGNYDGGPDYDAFWSRLPNGLSQANGRDGSPETDRQLALLARLRELSSSGRDECSAFDDD